MPSSETKARPAFMYDVDENGRPIQGTKKSATTEEKKKRHLVSHRPRDERQSKSDTGPKFEALMSGANQEPARDTKLERRKSSASTKSPSKSHNRPPSSHGNKSFPKTSIPNDHPSNYGIPTPTRGAPPPTQHYSVPQNIPLRPRAFTANTFPTPRPVSYHAAYTNGGYGTGPPLSASAYYQQQALPAPSYPPPSPSSSYMRYAGTPQQEYFAPNPVRPLEQRFGSIDPIQRSTSAYGVRDNPVQQQIQDAYDDGYTSASEGRRKSIRVPSASRRNSISRKPPPQPAYDQSMPPPPRPEQPRPGILRNKTTEYHPDTSRTTAPEPLYREYRDSSTPRASSHRNSVSYDLPGAHVETANTSHRRQSYYGESAPAPAPSGDQWEEKARNAQIYQQDVSGPSIPLTAEALRRRHASSSRSTKSSGSRDESDYRKSATTRTTRSGSGPDDGDVTIKVKGQARVMVGGAQIDCIEGGEIEIKRQKSIRNGSERSASEYGGMRIDDRRSKVERDPRRERKSSVHSGHSYRASTPHYTSTEWV